MMPKPPGFFVRQWSLSFVARGLACCLATLLLAYATKRVGPSWPSVPMIAMMTAFLISEWWYFHRADRPTDGYVGEVAVARALKPLESEGYRMLGPVRKNPLRHDIDQVVVGPTGLFAIEVKHWNGTMSWRGDKLYLGRWDKTSDVRKCVGHAMHLKKKVSSGLGLPWVEAVTVFSKDFPNVGCRHKKNYWTVPAEDLVGFIRSRQARLTEEECAWIASELG